MIAATLYARGGGCGEREFLSTLAFNHHALGTPLVDLAALYVLNLVARVDALGNFSHSSPFLATVLLSPFPESDRKLISN